jgi:metal-responsive CopG/Arc/MetJ family transcriptional regulator
MRTTIAIDESLIAELMRVEGDVSRSEAIRRAIEDYLKRRRIEKFMDLAGSGLVDMDWRTAKAAEVQKATRRARKR